MLSIFLAVLSAAGSLSRGEEAAAVAATEEEEEEEAVGDEEAESSPACGGVAEILEEVMGEGGRNSPLRLREKCSLTASAALW